MAEIDMVAGTGTGKTRLLGFAPLAGADALHAAIRAVPGPDFRFQAGSTVVALLQDEADIPLVARSREALTASLQSVQRRLEAACAIGPFLPMDPAAACCDADTVPNLLEAAWGQLERGLAQHGARQQWDIVLRWAPETVVARHRAEIAPAAANGPAALAEAVGAVLRAERRQREAALLSALAPAVLAFADGGATGTDTQVMLTILVGSGGETEVEAALDGMAAEHVEGASIDMRGPLPPVSFSVVRLVTVDAPAVIHAWSTLDLPDRIDMTGLHRQWRTRAAAVHPDRQLVPTMADHGAGVSDLTAAYRLLRDLMPPDGQHDRYTLESLLRRSGPRLVMPADAGDPVSPRQPTAEPAVERLLETLS